jgi:pyruvate formate lyase activating enzyme
MGLKIKMDTNGTNPEVINEGLNKDVIDYIAMDIKASMERYEEITQVNIDKEKIKRSLEIIMNRAPDYEFRTTVIKNFHNKEEIEKIGQLASGAKNFYLQRAQFVKTVEEGFKREQFSESELEEFRNILLKYVKICQIR